MRRNDSAARRARDVQESASARALEAQAQATRDAFEYQRVVAMEERLWNRRADLYARTVKAMRDHVDGGGDSPDSTKSPVLTNLASEADIMASAEARDIINDFVYSASPGEQIDMWDSFQHVARTELESEHFLERHARRGSNGGDSAAPQ